MASPIDPSKMTTEQRDAYIGYLNKRPRMMGDGITESIDILKKTRPKYKISDVYDENIALARAQAFAPDRSIQEQEKAIDETSSEAMGNAQRISGSTSALLESLSNVYSNKNKALRGIAQDQGYLQNQKMNQLMQANVMLGEEQDKEWNYNVNEPYQFTLQEQVERQKFQREQDAQKGDVFGSLLGMGASLLGGGPLSGIFGGGGGGGGVSAGYGSGYSWSPSTIGSGIRNHGG